MLRDSRIIADLYLENSLGTTTIGQSTVTTNPVITTPRPGVPEAASAYGEAGEQKHEKQLPTRNWVKVEKIVKNDVRDIDSLAHDIVTLIHGCSENEEVTAKVISALHKKHRRWSRK